MGTLFEQKPRETTLSGYIRTVVAEVANLKLELGCTTEEAIDMVRLAIELDNLDRKDEQLMGFGEILKDITLALESYVDLEIEEAKLNGKRL